MSSRFAVLLALGLGTACGPKHLVSGVIDADPDAGNDRKRAVLVESSGARHPLALSGDALWLADLGGCSVQIEGRDAVRRLVVDRWLVTDAGDGSQPYIGILERSGLQYQLRDRHSGAAIILAADSVGALQHEVDRPVLVAGYFAGPNRLHVVSWRVLRDLPGP